jgi:hypothetical protein
MYRATGSDETNLDSGKIAALWPAVKSFVQYLHIPSYESTLNRELLTKRPASRAKSA